MSGRPYSTMPSLLQANWERWHDRPWMRKKDLGFWRAYTWAEGYQKVKLFCLGLMNLGFGRGDVMAILGDNDPEWFWAELAAQSAGGVVVGISASCTPQELASIVAHCDAAFVVAQDQEQVDKVLEVKDRLPLVRRVVYWVPRGMRHYVDPVLLSFDEVLEMGREYERSHPGAFEEQVAQRKADDVALIQYARGTGSVLTGAVFDHRALCAANEAFYSVNPTCQAGEWFSFGFPGSVMEQSLGLLGSLNQGLRLSFPEGTETVQENMREIGATLILYPSNVWGLLASGTEKRVRESTRTKRLVHRLCMPVGYRVADMKLSGETPNLMWKALNALCELALFRPLKDKLGLLRVKRAFAYAGILPWDTLRMMTAVGLNLSQLYGSDEVTLAQLDAGEARTGSVGRVNPFIIVRITNDHHVLARGPACPLGYHKGLEAAEERFSEGWYRTGDAGYIDDEGHLYCLGRVECMRELADGTRFAPGYIEACLKASRYIKEAVVTGDKTRKFAAAIVTVDFDEIVAWAAERKIPYTDFADLSQKPAVCQLVGGEVEKANRRLPEHQRVKRFINSPVAYPSGPRAAASDRGSGGDSVGTLLEEMTEAVYRDRDWVVLEVPVYQEDGERTSVSVEVQVNRLV